MEDVDCIVNKLDIMYLFFNGKVQFYGLVCVLVLFIVDEVVVVRSIVYVYFWLYFVEVVIEQQIEVIVLVYIYCFDCVYGVELCL